MEIKKILILNLLCLNIYSADLPEHEKKTLIEATQKDYENLTKIVDELDKPQLQTFDENSIKIPIELIKPGTEFYLDQKPECKALIPELQVKTGIYYGDDVDSLPLGSAKNIKKDESDICITYSASTSCGDINCQFYKTNNEFRCVVVENNRIHRSKNAKQDFETIQLMYERQKAEYAKLYQGIKAEDLAKLAQDEFHAMQ